MMSSLLLDKAACATARRSAAVRSAIFELALAGLGAPAKHSALMVGDSLNSDIRGGRNAGIATCWYNPQRRSGGGDGLVDHEVATHDALFALVNRSLELANAAP